MRDGWDYPDGSSKGPAGWDWNVVVGTLLLAVGLVGIGFISGMKVQQMISAVPV